MSYSTEFGGVVLPYCVFIILTLAVSYYYIEFGSVVLLY